MAPAVRMKTSSPTSEGAVVGGGKAPIPSAGQPAAGAPAVVPEVEPATAPAASVVAAEGTPATGPAAEPVTARGAETAAEPATVPATEAPAPVVEEPPAAEEAVAPAVAALRRRAAKAASHAPAGSVVGSAQAAAIQPATEQQRSAAENTVKNLDAAQQQTSEVDKSTFRTKLREAIDKATPEPKTEEEAEELVSGGGRKASNVLQGTLATQKDAAVGPLMNAGAAEAPPAPGTDRAPDPLVPVQVGDPPAPVSAAPVVPAPLPAARLDYSEDRKATDTAMADAGVSQELLEKGNEPEFSQTLQARSEAEAHEAQAAPAYRTAEAGQRESAAGRARETLAGGLSSMQGARSAAIGTVAGQQVGTKSKDEAERQRITETIDRIKNDTRAAVETVLLEMETEATQIFGEGLASAEKAYGETFEEAKGGALTWATTWGDDWRDHITKSLKKAREEYFLHVDVAINKVSDCVDRKLVAAKKRVVDGQRAVQEFVAGLDDSVKSFGEEALAKVSSEFSAMTESIDNRKNALIENLTTQYKESYERMSAKEEELRNANKSLWDRIYDATVGLVQKILAFKNMLLSVLAKAADVVGDIIADPIGFLSNLVAGVMAGLKNFMANIGKHLKKGLMDWLFGALAGAGLTMPENFDLQGIVSIVLQVLGLTYANFRARAVKIVGEPVVAGLEKAAEVFKILLTEGVPGLWRFIKDKVLELKSMVLDAIFEFIREKVIVAGITWLIGLLNPASAFFKACKAIYDIVMFFINRGSQIAALINAVLDSVGAIAKGNIGVAAKLVEEALAKAVPVAIGFLAGLLGLGDISKTIRGVIDKARKPVNTAIDWVINQAVKLVKVAGKLIGGALGKEPKIDSPTANNDNGVLGLALEQIDAKLEDQATPANIKKVLAGVLSELSPVGLHGLRLESKNDRLQIVGEASPAIVLADLSSTAPKPQMHVRATIWFDEGSEPGGNALGAVDPEEHKTVTGQSFVYQVRKEHGGAGAGPRQRGGAVFLPQNPSKLEVLNWNSADMGRTSNSDHAEHHFAEWLNSIKNRWQNIRRIDIVNDPYSPCTACADELEGLAKHVSQARIRENPGANPLVATLHWTKVWGGAAENRTRPNTIPSMDHWLVQPSQLPPTGDPETDQALKMHVLYRDMRKRATVASGPPKVIRRRRNK
ncbi:hypothetical protein [Kocuria sp. NPDC057446]|uniref:phage tail protein n=1 Tax=Kocuria sp. NPDC057446 TaxID=3346137 RepID=UPI003685DC8A